MSVTESEQRQAVPPSYVLAPARMDRVATSFTTRCNLRCVYCPEGSHSEEFYGDMSPELLDELIAYCKSKGAYIDISYYGDSTFHEHFYEFARRILDAGVPIGLTSNLARLLRDEEIELVARFRTISFSVDTDNRDKAKAIRRGLDIRSLSFNVLRIRAYCLKNALPIPPLTLHAVLVDQNVRDLPNLIAFAAALGVNRVTCNEFAEMDGAKAVGELRSVTELRGLELMTAIASIKEAVALAPRLGVKFDFPESQAVRINAAAAGKLKDGVEKVGREGIQATFYVPGDDAWEVRPGMTRVCAEPWMGPILSPKGELHPCCTRGTVMGVVGADGSFAEVHDNEAHQKLRLSLLTGENLDTECRVCHLKPQTTPAEFQRYIAQYYPNAR